MLAVGVKSLGQLQYTPNKKIKNPMLVFADSLNLNTSTVFNFPSHVNRTCSIIYVYLQWKNIQALCVNANI